MNKADLQRALKTVGASPLTEVSILFGDTLVNIAAVEKFVNRIVIKAEVSPLPVDESPEPLY